MSQENVETVRRAYESITATRRLGPALFDEHFEHDTTQLTGGTITHGCDVAEELLRDYWETFEDFRSELEELIHAGQKQVVTACCDHGRIREGGGEVSNRFFHVLTIGEGRITHLSVHTDRSRALEAAGLSGETMSEENLRVVRAVFDTFSRGDTPALLELFDPSVVFTPLPDTPDLQSFHGHEGLLQGIGQTTEIWDDFSIELREMHDFDDHVLASLRWWGRGPSSGIQMEVDIAALFTFRKDKIVRFELFSSEHQALEAAGLSE